MHKGEGKGEGEREDKGLLPFLINPQIGLLLLLLTADQSEIKLWAQCPRKKILSPHNGREAQGVQFPEITLNDQYMVRSAIFTQLGAVAGDAVCVTARGTVCETWWDMEKEQREIIADGKYEERG